ncbi:MAG: hypothetical protein WC976_07020 [Caldisericia bacterium]
MLKINITALTEWVWRTTINIAPWPIDKVIEKIYWARGDKWFQKEQQRDPAFRRLTVAIFSSSANRKLAEAEQSGNKDLIKSAKEEAEIWQSELNWLDMRFDKLIEKYPYEKRKTDPKMRQQYAKEVACVFKDSPFMPLTPA